MKILAFTDIHGNLKSFEKIQKLIKKENPDILIDCGDISIFENDLDHLLGRLNSFNKRCLIIHGNHEEKTRFKKACKKHKNLIFLHNKTYRSGNYLFYGYGNGGFSLNDKTFEKAADKSMKEKRENDILILLTHGPPYDTKLDKLWGQHVGNKSIRKFIKKYEPIIALSGHLHENNRVQDNISKTKVINPGPNGKIIVV